MNLDDFVHRALEVIEELDRFIEQKKIFFLINNIPLTNAVKVTLFHFF